jgi:hypothetical protein
MGQTVMKLESQLVDAFIFDMRPLCQKLGADVRKASEAQNGLSEIVVRRALQNNVLPFQSDFGRFLDRWTLNSS